MKSRVFSVTRQRAKAALEGGNERDAVAHQGNRSQPALFLTAELRNPYNQSGKLYQFHLISSRVIST